MSELEEQFVGKLDIRTFTVIMDADKKYTWFPMIGHIVGKSTDRLMDLFLARDRSIALHTIRFDIIEEGFQFIVVQMSSPRCWNRNEKLIAKTESGFDRGSREE